MTITEPQTDENSPLGDDKPRASNSRRQGLRRRRQEAVAAGARFWSSLRWLIAGMTRVAGRRRFVGIALLALAGSAGISFSGFVTLAVIRLAAPNSGLFSFLGFDPDWPLPVMYSLIIAGGVLGAYLFYRSEREVSRAAVEFGVILRRDMVARIEDPNNRGWQAVLTERPQQVVMKVAIADVREITLAAREAVRMLGPAAIVVASAVAMALLEPVITAAILPVVLLAGVPLLLINRSVDRLNESVESASGNARERISASILEMNETADDRQPMLGLATAQLADEFTHQRLLQPTRVRAVSMIAASLFIVLVISIFIARTPEDGDINFIRVIVYLITFRLCLASAQKLGAGAINVTRRSMSMERYRSLRDQLEEFSEERRERARNAATPHRLRIRLPRGQRLVVRRGQTVVVIVSRLPSITTAEDFLLAVEETLIDSDDGVDLLGSARLELADRPATREPPDDFEDPPAVVRVVVRGDPLDVAAETTAAFTFVVTQLPRVAWSETLDQWSHLIGGVVVFLDGNLVLGGDLEWANSNRRPIMKALGR